MDDPRYFYLNQERYNTLVRVKEAYERERADLMGRDQRQFIAEGLVSRHNSRQDNIDDLIWEDFCEEVDRVVEEFNKKYPMFSLEIIRADHYDGRK